VLFLHIFTMREKEVEGGGRKRKGGVEGGTEDGKWEMNANGRGLQGDVVYPS
jgi:hypothetical protein